MSSISCPKLYQESYVHCFKGKSKYVLCIDHHKIVIAQNSFIPPPNQATVNFGQYITPKYKTITIIMLTMVSQTHG